MSSQPRGPAFFMNSINTSMSGTLLVSKLQWVNDVPLTISAIVCGKLSSRFQCWL
ncbi:hypothetical protein P171DRAFT_430182 [Karstenula rhodostoma CBS 690.94]|uniref:Uncharacterized protein n=1 Tax=Karstenula rhodostoma CBS 690.94 TaxID=1392251 RepID=A0A9P4UCZ6_9PLEO|nr:hypothetical protein P171DRAFT_430182 [Karstenula rhodostoma CBS 690.94]